MIIMRTHVKGNHNVKSHDNYQQIQGKMQTMGTYTASCLVVVPYHIIIYYHCMSDVTLVSYTSTETTLRME